MSEGVQDEFPELWATQPVKGVPGPGSACGGAQRWDRQAVGQPGAGGRAAGLPARCPPTSRPRRPAHRCPSSPWCTPASPPSTTPGRSSSPQVAPAPPACAAFPSPSPGRPGPFLLAAVPLRGPGAGGGPSHRPVPRAGRRPPEGGWVPEFAPTARAVHTAWGWRQGPPALRVGFPASVSRPDSRGQQPPRPQNSGPLPSPPDPTPAAQVGQWGPRLKGGRGGARRRPP